MRTSNQRHSTHWLIIALVLLWALLPFHETEDANHDTTHRPSDR